MRLARNPLFHARMQHIEVHYHYMHEWIVAGHIDLQHIGTDLQIIDIFTKAIEGEKLRQFSVTLGIRGNDTNIDIKDNDEVEGGKYNFVMIASYLPHDEPTC